jgi:glycine betaine/choline ABC-type transport system substrate-binding protein
MLAVLRVAGRDAASFLQGQLTHDVRLLADDLGVIPPYDALVLAGPRLLAEAPEAVAALVALDAAIDAPSMQRMSLAVDRDGLAPAEVARRFLEGLVSDPAEDSR